jgi:hypothetical protein
MAATFAWCEDNGALTSSHGTTRTGFASGAATDRNYKAVDDSTGGAGGTAYSANPITAGNNAMIKFLYGKYSGTFNQISAGKWSLRTAPSGALATGLTLKGKVTSTYATPATTAIASTYPNDSISPTDYTSAEIAIGSGTSVSFHTTGPEGASPTATLSAAGYTQYLCSQLQTSGSAGAGDITSMTETLQYNEN